MSIGIEDIERKVATGDQIPKEQFVAAMKGAIQERSIVTYLIWKELEEKLGRDEATAILARVHRRFGQISGQRWGEVHDAAEALYAQINVGGVLVWEQSVSQCSPEYAQKDFKACPHIEAFRSLGATDEEVRILCQDILSEGDYGNLDPHEGVEVSFSAQIGAGDDHCSYCLSCTKQ